MHELTITNWERNATDPAIRHIPAIIRFLEYDPAPPASTFPERIAVTRRRHGMSQRKMAAKLGVDPTTLRDWEVGRHQPAKKSLDMIGRVLQSRERW